MECPKCKSEVTPGSKFCTTCGAPLNVKSNACCPVCGAEIPAGAKFCVSCGHNLQISSSQTSVDGRTVRTPELSKLDRPVSGQNLQYVPETPTFSSGSDENDSPKKWVRNWWVIALAIVAVGLAVALILVLTGNKGKSDYNRPDKDIFEVVESEDTTYVPEAEETAVSGSFTVSGMWSSLDVRLEIEFTVYPSGYISASGYAYYGESGLKYRLTGGGEDGETYSTLNLSEYSTEDNNEYTGKWVGRAVYKDGEFNYSGTFYSSNGDEYCSFDLNS